MTIDTNLTRVSRLLKSREDLPGASLRTRLMLAQLRSQARHGPGALRLKVAELLAFASSHPNAARELGLSDGGDNA